MLGKGGGGGGWGTHFMRGRGVRGGGGSRSGGGRRAHFDLNFVVRLLTTHPFGDGAPFLLVIEVPTPFGRSLRFFHIFREGERCLEKVLPLRRIDSVHMIPGAPLNQLPEPYIYIKQTTDVSCDAYLPTMYSVYTSTSSVP